MQLLIHIESNSSNRGHGTNPVIEWTRKTHPGVTTFDLNTLAQSSITAYALDLIKQADQIMLIIEIKIERNMQLIRDLIETALRLEGKQLQWVLNGKGAMIASTGAKHPLRDLPARGQKKLISEFFRTKG